MKSIACCQPHYLPWIGYFEMIDRVDEFWLLDDVDFIKREWKNRNRIRKERTSSETKWLTVPIARESQRGTWMCAAKLANESEWRTQHLDSLRHVYGGSAHFQEAMALAEKGLGASAATLADLNAALLRQLCDHLGIATELRRTSELSVAGKKTEKLVAICQAAGATHYLANNGSAAYLDTNAFLEAGITCDYQDYAHPNYRQACAGEELPFLSHLSILDLIANHGPESLAILRQGRPVPS